MQALSHARTLLSTEPPPSTSDLVKALRAAADELKALPLPMETSSGPAQWRGSRWLAQNQD